jgi:hypothetical protein
MSNPATFFSIVPPAGEDARVWAHRMWDTYGFDYDNERCGPCILAWPCERTEEELSQALEADGIMFSTFEADADELFGS